MLYEIENIPIIGIVINTLIGIGFCFLVAFLLCKIPNPYPLPKPFNGKQAKSLITFVCFHSVISSPYFINSSLDWKGDNPIEIVKAYHDICEKNTVYLRK